MVDKATVTKMIEGAPVIMFSKTFCPYCKKAKQAMKQITEDFEVVEVRHHPGQMRFSGYLCFGTSLNSRLFVSGSQVFLRFQLPRVRVRPAVAHAASCIARMYIQQSL